MQHLPGGQRQAEPIELGHGAIRRARWTRNGAPRNTVSPPSGRAAANSLARSRYKAVIAPRPAAGVTPGARDPAGRLAAPRPTTPPIMIARSVLGRRNSVMISLFAGPM